MRTLGVMTSSVITVDPDTSATGPRTQHIIESNFEVGRYFRCNRLATEKLPHETRRLFGLLEMRQMAGSGDQRDTGIGDPLGKILRVVGRDHRVRVAPNDQARRRDPVYTFFQTLIRDRPDEFSCAGL